MILADVNVLLQAFRRDAAEHAVCWEWLDRVVDQVAPFGIATLVLSSVIRIATTRKVFDPPSETADALAFCNELLGQPHAILLQPGERHWSIFASLCTESGIRGPRVTDAWFAALAIEHGCEWVTLDRDYARFSGLKWSSPVAT